MFESVAKLKRVVLELHDILVEQRLPDSIAKSSYQASFKGTPQTFLIHQQEFRIVEPKDFLRCTYTGPGQDDTGWVEYQLTMRTAYYVQDLLFSLRNLTKDANQH